MQAGDLRHAHFHLLGVFFGTLADEAWLDGKLRHGGPDPESDHLGRDAKFGKRFFDQPGSLVDVALIRPDGLFTQQHI